MVTYIKLFVKTEYVFSPFTILQALTTLVNLQQIFFAKLMITKP